jgi:hypothetical protein
MGAGIGGGVSFTPSFLIVLLHVPQQNSTVMRQK